MKIITLFDISILKTVYFNFKYLSVKQAAKFPIFVSRRVRVRRAKGEIIINGDIKPGLVRIGMDCVGIFDNVKSRSIWQVDGRIIFNGSCFLGHGCKISVASGGVLSFGNNFTASAESSIAAVKSIIFGDGVMLSWDILIMDTDWHTITDCANNVINVSKPITIGDNVWIGCRSIILKGVTIAQGVIIAAGSIVAKNIIEQNCIAGKNPLQVVKHDVYWRR